MRWKMVVAESSDLSEQVARKVEQAQPSKATSEVVPLTLLQRSKELIASEKALWNTGNVNAVACWEAAVHSTEV